MKKAIIAGLLLSPFVVMAQTAVFVRDLKIGDRGADVLQLQKFLNSDLETRIATAGVGSSGQETDYFGPLTKSAVMKFQNKYRSEVLNPLNIGAPTGYVGILTRAKLSSLGAAKTPVATPTSPPAPVTTTVAPAAATLAPIKPIGVLSVSPNKVRRGDSVTIAGENFTKTGNTVIIADGMIWTRFSNLPSSDGKTITFTYTPPIPDEMKEADFRALPQETLAYLETHLKKYGAELSDLWAPDYEGLNSEAEVKDALEKNGFSFDNLYYYFWINIRNANGEWESQGPLLYGLRAFPFDTINASNASPSLLSQFRDRISKVAGSFIPVASADYGGGLNLGKIQGCNCSGGYVTFQISYGGQGFGTFFYYYSNGFRPIVGSPKNINNWLGFYDSFGAILRCWKRKAFFCVPIIPVANAPKNPIGFSMWP